MSLGQKNSRIRQNGVLVPFIFILIVISADQWTKFLAVKFLTTNDELTFLNSFFTFTLIRNHGGFLGVVNNLPENGRFFLLTLCVSVLLFGCLVYLLGCKNKTARYDIPLAFVTGGGVGNLLDRLLHNGGVLDFLSIGFGNFRTGIFNLADLAILIGSFVLGYTFFTSPSALE